MGVFTFLIHSIFCGFRTLSAEYEHSFLSTPNADLDLKGKFDSDLMERQILGLILATFQGILRNFDGVLMKFDDR